MANHLLLRIKEYDAHGGPVSKSQDKADKFAATPTNAGRFVIHTIEKHISTQRYFWFSGVPWGAGLKNIHDVIYVDIKNNNHWVKLTSVVPQWLGNHRTESDVTRNLKNQWYYLSNVRSGGGFVDMDTRELPDKWFFSDFGHISVKYFPDPNHNGIMDNSETLMNDFIHTTPDNEAVSAYNLHRTPSQRPIALNLAESHGCIHVKPVDIDIMIGSGYLKKGQTIVVHSYNDKTIPATIKPDRYTRGHFETHFFPGRYKIVVYKIT
ncbi:hypothetical protein [Mucilaginibacter sp.]|uniref:hypothetical protein n=1 Tax=Mucilaginibacter sp. TaxID=1882438 RepID=UPI0035BC380D